MPGEDPVGPGGLRFGFAFLGVFKTYTARVSKHAFRLALRIESAFRRPFAAFLEFPRTFLIHVLDTF